MMARKMMNQWSPSNTTDDASHRGHSINQSQRLRRRFNRQKRCITSHNDSLFSSHRRCRSSTCTVRLALHLLLLSIPSLLLLPHQTILPTTHAMIYLEDPTGALRYDSLPVHPPEWEGAVDNPEMWVYFNDIIPQMFYTRENFPFRLGTPGHYLRWWQPHSDADTDAAGPDLATADGSASDGNSSSATNDTDISSIVLTDGNSTINKIEEGSSLFDNSSTLDGIFENSTSLTSSSASNLTPTAETNTTNSSLFSSSSIPDGAVNGTEYINTPPSSLFDDEPPSTNYPTQQAQEDQSSLSTTTASPGPTTSSTAVPTYVPTRSPTPTSVIPEITGEFSQHYFHHHTSDTTSSTSSSSDDGYYYYNDDDDDEQTYPSLFNYFNDLKLIHSPNQYVYYDSKQARFGVDLGPRGNAEFVNLILPPRWYGAYWEQKEEEEVLNSDTNVDGVIVDGGVKDEGELGMNVDVNVTDMLNTSDASGETMTNMTDSISTIGSGDNGNPIDFEWVNSTNNTTEDEGNLGNTTNGMGNNNTERNNNDELPTERRTLLHQRRLETLGELWEDFSSEAPVGSTTSENIFDVTIDSESTSKNDTTTLGIIDDPISDSNTNSSTTILNETTLLEGNGTILAENATSSTPPPTPMSGLLFGSPHGIPIADYFCFEDFRNWRIQQRNISSSEDNDLDHRDNIFDSDNAFSSETSDHNNVTATPDLDGNLTKETTIFSTRPLAILAQRGRCSFESKAKMAMVLNDLFASSGRLNRIEHIVVYNNGTDSDNNTQNEETLIDMSRVSQLEEQPLLEDDEGDDKGSSDDGSKGINDGQEEQEEDDIRVGLVYITTPSGMDLLRRIREREAQARAHPYLDVSMLFPPKDNVNSKDDASSVPEGVTHKRRMKHPDGSTEHGDYGGSVLGQDSDKGYYDEEVTHGWFFPATLTRFCFSCGPSMHYGLDWDVDSDNYAGSDDSSHSHPTPGDGNGGGSFRPIDHNGRFPGHTTVDYYSKPWLEVIRKLMVAILILLLVGPLLLAARRWYTVGGTFRITTDENGQRRIRIVSPNLEVFVNGVPDTVETNGTKLDRAQVFALPEIEYAGRDGDEENVCEYNQSQNGVVEAVGVEGDQSPSVHEHLNDDDIEERLIPPPQSPTADSVARSPPPQHISTSPSRDTVTSHGFVSSSTCSICIDEFTPGEMLRLLPRCNHMFHTECILPWLTERQGCCPMCKMPVLPEELQRSRSRRRQSSRRRSSRNSSSRSNNRRETSSGGRALFRSRRHQPQSMSSTITNASSPLMPATAQSTTGIEESSASTTAGPSSNEGSPIVTGIRLVSEIEGDLDAAAPLPPQPLRVVTPDGSPTSNPDTLVPLGTDRAEGSLHVCEGEVDALSVLEQGNSPVRYATNQHEDFIGTVLVEDHGEPTSQVATEDAVQVANSPETYGNIPGTSDQDFAANTDNSTPISNSGIQNNLAGENAEGGAVDETGLYPVEEIALNGNNTSLNNDANADVGGRMPNHGVPNDSPGHRASYNASDVGEF